MDIGRLQGLRARLLAVVLVGIIPTSVLLYLQIADQQATMLAQVRGEAERFVTSTAGEVTGVLEAARSVLLGASQAPAIEQHEKARADSLCRGVLGESIDYSNVSVVDGVGRVWASALPAAVGTDLSREPWFAALKSSGRFTTGGYEISPVTGKATVVCAFPVLDTRGRLRAAMISELRIDAFRKVLAAQALPYGGASLLVDTSGAVVARVPTLRGVEGTRLVTTQLVSTVLSKGRGTGRLSGLDGVGRIYAFRPVVEQGQTSLLLAVGFDERQIDASANRAYRQALISLLIIGTLALGLAWLLAENSVTRPARRLIEISRRLASGDLTARSNLPLRSDEFGQLGAEFDAMAAAVDTRLHELEKARAELARLNRDLDRRVALRTAEIEESNRELEAFSYSVSHDLRAPLRAIDGFSQALLEDHTAELSAEGRGHLERVRAAASRMGQLIDSLLALSRLSRAPMEPERVDISGLAARISAELAEEEPERNVAVRVEPGLETEGDEALLSVLLENLLRNAWKFTQGRAEAHIEVGSAEADGGRAFFVKDDGAGFDMAHVDKLFGAFQRLHRNEEFPGLGIGLATAYRIARRHGGTMWATGEPDKGATFYFTVGPLSNIVSEDRGHGREGAPGA
jgi:signal transduction histidine kinase